MLQDYGSGQGEQRQSELNTNGLSQMTSRLVAVAGGGRRWQVLAASRGRGRVGL